jgi:3-isopropylmalate/(R)-2-methylmalate dehydratase large subunit
MLKERGLKVARPDRSFATVDHIVPTDAAVRPLPDDLAEKMLQALDENAKKNGIEFFNRGTGKQGIVHVVGPELGLTQPGMTIVCGDSHTSTHGAFGALAFGIGTSQIRDVLATQTIAMSKPKLRRIRYDGKPGKGVYAKDLILALMARKGVNGGIGYAYEYAGEAVDAMTMEERLTICNMTIEGGARFGYVNPDETTVEYLRGRPYAPAGDDFEKAAAFWRSVASDADTVYDDELVIDASVLEPMVTWGINPGQAIGVSDRLPDPASMGENEGTARAAYEHMGFTPGSPIKGQKIDVAFIGSCTNARISDLREAAKIVRGHKVSPKIRALVVPGSERVKKAAEAEGLHEIFREAGFDWREAGCSMCLAMNPDKLQDREISASSSNRNFIGRQGSPKGRTLLMSPAMVAAAAIAGEVVDVRAML